MNYSALFIVSGLGVNTIASLIMLYPYLNINRYVDDDLILKMNMKTGKYYQKKHLKNRKLGIIGFSLFAMGFVLQIIGIVLER
ncbi:MAG: hypothetical protein HYW63_00270 [Candidatus Levybacteria bacterium]|nr:hypothetical protein [Candidatus Levybacteria bacterium]